MPGLAFRQGTHTCKATRALVWRFRHHQSQNEPLDLEVSINHTFHHVQLVAYQQKLEATAKIRNYIK